MYAKVLLPDVVSGAKRPFVIATAPADAETIDVLAGRGWTRSTGNPPNVDGQVIITPGSLTVMSQGQVILADNANPTAPPGWWESVDAHGGQAVVWVVPSEVDLGAGDQLGGQLADVIEQRSSVWAELPVTT